MNKYLSFHPKCNNTYFESTFYFVSIMPNTYVSTYVFHIQILCVYDATHYNVFWWFIKYLIQANRKNHDDVDIASHRSSTQQSKHIESGNRLSPRARYAWRVAGGIFFMCRWYLYFDPSASWYYIDLEVTLNNIRKHNVTQKTHFYVSHLRNNIGKCIIQR